MSNNSNNPQLNELVSFLQHDIPGLDDGQYQLQVAQEVTDAKGNIVQDDTITSSYSFAVAGDRFGLKKPDQLIYSLFPAANATGEFNTVLPSVVLTQTTFPWSRYPTNTLGEEYQPLAPGQDVDEDVSTWLTILLLDEDDLNRYKGSFPSFALPPGNATIGDLFTTSVNPGSTLGTGYSYFYGVTDLSKPLADYMDPGDQLTDSIQVLDIPLPLFWAIAPTIADLRLMAHVRRVSLLNKATMPGISDVGEPEGSFSIVFGNRLPGTMKKSYAYLVSLEEMENFLPTDEQGGTPAGNKNFTPDPTKMLRLAVLASWTFYSTGESATFVRQLQALNQAAPPVGNTTNGDLSANTNLRLAAADKALPLIKNALSMGYVPLDHDLRTGELAGNTFTRDKTVSWYRGPLTPYLIDKAAIQLPVVSPDQAMIFDPTTGMLDMSYAVAWTLGRQLALQDTGFSTALYNWKKGLTQQVINDMENQLLTENFSTVFAPVEAQALKMQQASPRPGNFLLKSILSVAPKK